ncbi:F0F1 ATP synthase subunit A [Acidocella aromatica]|uniref:ATP synthase subunit a n=1 Tax=Acidocella aromatica TaxID=1303579 RepID=A0A840VRC6_9PROT|nr:F0F1 ATP synthase subunit A [Acidocella aromatica]MBB5374141.1 F-type H+-transporting ATPase subunit a [Acidocella aromatica]MDR3683569.1 F0F1 ATP synthase subunit A [Geothrix sp.]
MAGPTIDALGQFSLTTGLGSLGRAVNFTNSNEAMLGAAAVIVAVFALGLKSKALVPGRAQSLVEMLYEFVRNMCVDTIGEEGLRFFPLVFTIFSFILLGNLLGLFPYFFAFTSHIAVTLTLALFVFVFSTGVGFYTHGFKFLKFFVPSGVPTWLLPLLVPIEIISYLSRPVSLSVRLFANMTAGHVMWEVFAGFMLLLTASFGVLGAFASVVPLSLNVALAALELLVAGLQAYVFAILTCLYLHDAVHMH